MPIVTLSPYTLEQPLPNHTGSSAAVIEYLCLFTHDLRRKQKRWQDGRVKYHTFNRRIMVYDDRGNFVGDAYWQSDGDFDVGEELELERGGAIVQVSDCVGQQTQDLSELLDKRVREKGQRHVSVSPGNAPSLGRGGPQDQQTSSHFQLRHRPLTELIQTPAGRHGRAVVPMDSPFDQRHGSRNVGTTPSSERQAKRRKLEKPSPPSKLGYAQSLFGATLTLSGGLTSSAPLRRQPACPPSTRALPVHKKTGIQKDEVVPIPDSPGAESRHRPEGTTASRRAKHAENGSVSLAKGPAHCCNNVLKPGFVADAGFGPAMGTAGRTVPTKGNNVNTNPPRNMNPIVKEPEPGLSAFANSHTRAPSPTTSYSCADKIQSREKPVSRTTTRTGQSSLVAPCAVSDGMHTEHHGISAIPQVQEQKTELRLKPRRKRGLMVVMESQETQPALGRCPSPPVLENRSPTLKSSTHPETCEPPVSLRSGFGGTELDNVHSGLVNPQMHSRKCEIQPDATANPTDTTAEAGRPPKRKGALRMRNSHEIDQSSHHPRTETRKTPSLESLPTLSDQNMAPAKPGVPPSNASDPGNDKMNGGRKSPIHTDEERFSHSNDVSGPAGPPSTGVPRLVRFARKGIKSREVIGYSHNSPEAAKRPSRLTGSPPAERIVARVAPEEYRTESSILGIGSISYSKPVPDGLRTGDRSGAGVPAHPQEITTVLSERSIMDKETGPVDTEIISMVTEPEIPVRAPTRPAPSPDGARDRLKNHDSEDVPFRSHGVDSSRNQEAPGAQHLPRKLVNPATRGRKAALKSDAAGQAPQSFVPADRLDGVRTGRATGDSATATNNELPKTKMTFPGFMSARGSGAWSREAHDLLERGRPV
ncbi:hypothetical protein VTK73DRAFT_6124 [Phialemonium thermophilum]|uniref:5'-3' DNA helicase ZGRF1-like N-terminal domain-containing protein n=1 Tax=Phialemonium thermophilum TaxID=223376 RepID=A0ABR3WL92_9PEZI